MTDARRGSNRLDRFGTLNIFVREKQAALTAATGSPSAAVVWFTLFALANGRDGTVRGASRTRVASLTGLTRKTVAAAMAVLVEQGAMKIAAGRGPVPTYVLEHLSTDE